MADEKKGNEKKEPNYLAAAVRGLEFRTNQAQVDKETKKKTYVPIVRPMTVDDVLSHRRDGSKVYLVAKDGSKYTVDLSGSGE